MKANQLYVDNISNNLSNVNTAGFKKSRVDFEDLMYQTLEEPGMVSNDGMGKPTGKQVGLGVSVTGTQKMFHQGELTQTSNPLDLAIQGEGFFQIRMPGGEIGFSRNGGFQINGEGYLTSSQGMYLEPGIQVPVGFNEITVSPDGLVSTVDLEGIPEEIGQIEMARFVNPAGLKSLGGNLFASTPAAGEMSIDNPGSNNMGHLRSNYLEASNVQMVEEMVDMIVAQRAYEISSKSISTSDEMLQTANQLKR
jgi:flagellar basal-body rod protein FlgG